MESANHTLANQYSEKTESANLNWWTKMEADSEFNRYGIISMAFLLIGICGGVAIALSAYAHIWQISIIAVLTMLSLSLMLAVAPMKYIIRVTAAALLLDVVIVALNAIL